MGVGTKISVRFSVRCPGRKNNEKDRCLHFSQKEKSVIINKSRRSQPAGFLLYKPLPCPPLRKGRETISLDPSHRNEKDCILKLF
jgi:hypothetical protein